jgi:hypothetical protein
MSIYAFGGFFAIQRSAAFLVSHRSGKSRVSSLAANDSASQRLAHEAGLTTADGRSKRAASR